MDFTKFMQHYHLESDTSNLISKEIHPDDSNLIILQYKPKTKRNQYTSFYAACQNVVLDSKTESILGRAWNQYMDRNDIHSSKVLSEEFLDFHYPNEVVEITEKYDGVIASSYWLNGKLRFAAEGSFTSTAAHIAEELWNLQYHKKELFIEKGISLIVNVIHPELKIVIPYSEPKLVLAGAIHQETGLNYSYEQLVELGNNIGMDVPKKYEISLSVAFDLMDTCVYDFPGYMVRYGNENRASINSAEYNHVYQWLYCNDSYIRSRWIYGQLDDDIASLPPLFRDRLIETRNELEATRLGITKSVYEAYTKAPKTKSNQEFVTWVSNNIDEIFHPIIYNLHKGKTITEQARTATVGYIKRVSKEVNTDNNSKAI